MINRQQCPFKPKLLVVSILSLFWVTPVLPQTRICQIQGTGRGMLTCAKIYLLENNNVFYTPPNQTSQRRVTRGQSIFEQGRLQSFADSRAELQFNEGSLAWTKKGTTFSFTPGKRRVELINGKVLVLVKPGGGGVIVGTSSVTVEAKGTALVVEHNEATGESVVTVLTNNPKGPVTVASNRDGKTVELRAGQAVSAVNGVVGSVQNFDLQTYYATNELAAGLGPGQEAIVAQKPLEVQQTINAVRIETLAAVKEQGRGFRRTFLSDALTGGESDLYSRRGQSLNIQIDTIADGIFTRTGDNVGIFTPTTGGTIPAYIQRNPDGSIPITLDFDQQTIAIGGVTGTASYLGLSGNNASGTIVLNNGQIVRVEAFGVDGNEPNIAPNPGSSFRGRLITGIAPDR